MVVNKKSVSKSVKNHQFPKIINNNMKNCTITAKIVSYCTVIAWLLTYIE